MPLRANAPVGAPTWIDLMSSDTDASRAFYGELFGWTSEQGGEEYGGYITFAREGVTVAGLMQNQPQFESPDGWSVYLATADAKATADAIVEHGGQIYMPPMDVFDLGVMVVAADPTGATICAWEPGTHPGFGVLEEPNAPSWFELFTREHEAAVAFYTDVFGWDAHTQGDTDEFRYTTLGDGDDQKAGIMDATSFLAEGQPAHWSVYFQVEDADAIAARTVELGGAVVAAPMDTPYGRIGTLTDATGSVFKIQQP